MTQEWLNEKLVREHRAELTRQFQQSRRSLRPRFRRYV
jgi:hypothetical protein